MSRFYTDQEVQAIRANPENFPDADMRKLARSKQFPRPGLGVIRWRLHRFCLEQGGDLVVTHKSKYLGQPNLSAVFRRTRVSRDTLFYIIRYPETVKSAHFKTLARLCYGLKCQPGDLLEYLGAEQADSPLSEQYKQYKTDPLPPE